MERLCLSCNQVKKSPYKDICRNCYQDKWLKSLPEKHCEECGKVFKVAGKICHNCQSNKRNKESRKISCSCCERNGLILACFNPPLCIKCDRLKKEKNNPELCTKRKNYLRTYSRKKKGKNIDDPIRKSKGWWKESNGYIMTYKKGHPNSNTNDCIKMHTLVMSEHLGRPLGKNENVHHINGIKDDNRIENLELWHRGQPPGQRLDEKIEWAKNFLKEYGYVVNKVNI